MALGKNRLAFFVYGLGTMELCQRVPVANVVFDNAGYLEATVINDTPTMVDIVPETGDLVSTLRSAQKVTLKTSLQQSGIDEINLIRGAANLVYAIRYHGKASDSNLYQFWAFEQAMVRPNPQLTYNVGKRILVMEADIIVQDELTYIVPPYYVWQGNDIMYFNKMRMFLDPSQSLNSGTNKLLDIGGLAYHGTITSAFATIWNAGGFLRFDGAADTVNFGDVLDDDATSDFAIEGWIRIQGANAGLEQIFTKKNGLGNAVGYGFYRQTTNKIIFSMATGAAEVQIISTTSVLQNVWTHIGVTIDRNGNGQIYINGVADGAAVSVAALATCTNSVNLTLASDNGGAGAFGQIDAGALRFYVYGAGNLPSNSATMMSKHFSSERLKYGI